MNHVYIIDGKPHRVCDCSLHEGRCPIGVKRILQTTHLSQCLIPMPDAIIDENIKDITNNEE